MIPLPTRLPAPRRAALVLAVLLVPVTALPALAGLAVCFGPDGASTTWDVDSNCARRALQARLAMAHLTPSEAPATTSCVMAPGVEAVVTAEAASVPTTSSSFLLPGTTQTALPPATPEAFTERGPPLAVHRALRSVVLRI